MSRVRSFLVAAVLAIVVLQIVTSEFGRREAMAATRRVEAATAAMILQRLEISPQSLAAAGADPDQVGSFLQSVVQVAGEISDGIAAVDVIYSDRARQSRELERNVKAGLCSEEEIEASRVASAATEATAAMRRVRLSQAAEALRESLPGEIRARLTMIRANRERTVPVEYRLRERSASMWRELRDVLALERVCEKKGEPVPGEAMEFLDVVRSEPSVASALASHDANYEAVAAIWHAWLGDTVVD